MTEKLSVSDTRKLVGEVIASQAQPLSTSATKIKPVSQETRRLQKLSLNSLKKAERTQLLELQEVLRQKLAEIEEVLKLE